MGLYEILVFLEKFGCFFICQKLGEKNKKTLRNFQWYKQYIL